MAKATIKDQNNDVTGAAERMADLDESEGGELFRAIEEARSTQGAEVILTRTMPADKAGFCDKIPVAEFDLSMLKTKYGAGTYRVRFNGPTGFLPGGSTIKIAAMPEKPAAQTGTFETFLEQQARRDAERSSKLWDLAMISVPALIAGFFSRQPSNDIGSLVTALKPAPGPSITDLTSALANMQQLTGANKPQESQIDTILRVFESAKDLIGDKDGGNKEGSNWIDVIRDAIKYVPEAIKPALEARIAAMQQTQTPVKQVTPQIAPTAQPPNISPIPENIPVKNSAGNAETIPVGNDMRAIWEAIAKQHLAKVVGWAEKDRDPNTYAEVFVDELPDLASYLTIDQVLEHLQNPQWFEIICTLEPRLSSHREYCDEMREAVISIVKGLKEDALEIAGEAPVNADSTGSHPATEA